MKQLTPKQIVKELNRYIIGQNDAKKAVAIALRNRWRRQQVEGSLKDEIMPNNIIMIGSTGVGKTEIARRLASLSNAPFIKVEASKFTEVGYVGRDVESMVRDLMDTSVSLVEREKESEVIELAERLANERVLDILFPNDTKSKDKQSEESKKRYERTREKMRGKLDDGKFEDKMIEIEVSDEPAIGMQVFGPLGMEDIGMNIKDMLSGSLPKSKRSKKNESKRCS
jgi:ATP-dependent HslUV protease ATP-binding subunit HslU